MDDILRKQFTQIADEYNVDRAMGDPLEAMHQAYCLGRGASTREVLLAHKYHFGLSDYDAMMCECGATFNFWSRVPIYEQWLAHIESLESQQPNTCGVGLPPQRSMSPEEVTGMKTHRKTKFKRVAGGAIEGEPRRLNTHDVFLSVYEDIKQRNELGWAQHAKPLLVDDHSLLGWLEEAYAETLDKAVYLKGAILKLKGDSNV